MVKLLLPTPELPNLLGSACQCDGLSRSTQGCCQAPTTARAGTSQFSVSAQALLAVVSHGCCALSANCPCIHAGSKALGQPCKIG